VVLSQQRDSHCQEHRQLLFEYDWRYWFIVTEPLSQLLE
jgi:hypothetical protein